MSQPLETELAAFNKMLPNLLPHEGKFALFIGNSFIGVFGTYEDGLRAGYQQAKLAPFLVKQISGTETISYFSREIDMECPTIQLL